MQGSLLVVCNPFKGMMDFFAYPLALSSIGIYKACGVSSKLLVIPVCDILRKCYLIPCDPLQQSLYPCALFPLIHAVTDEQM